jgi:phospholipid-binding lipoprotein MlaA
MNRLATALACAALGLLCGCASVPKDPAARAEFREIDDPWEPMNRPIFAFNDAVDKALIRPLAEGYIKVIPPKGRDAIRNVVQNLGEPLVLANSLLQANFRRAGRATARFLINTTIGIAGIRDVAAKQGMPYEAADFGQTLYVWGAHRSPYLVLPVLGPSSPRDGVGMGVDFFLDPWRYASQSPTWFSVAQGVAGGIDERARSLDALDELRKEAVDYYGSFRSFYRQHRQAELTIGGQATAAPVAPADLYSDPGK